MDDTTDICQCQVYRVIPSNRQLVCLGLVYERDKITDVIFYDSGYRITRKLEYVRDQLNQGKLIPITPPWKR